MNKGYHHIIKIISFYFMNNKKLYCYNLERDTWVGINIKIAKAIDHSTRKNYLIISENLNI